MSGFAYRIAGGKAQPADHEAAIGARNGFIWVHLDGIGEREQAWLRETAKLEPIIVETLTALESRPRCDVFDHSAFVNLRG